MAHDVFISYSARDKQIADAVCNILEANGFRCWYAPRDVRAGSEWASAIMAGITQSRVMVLVLSSNSNMSKDVTREVKHAFRKEVTVIPFRVEDIAPTPALQYFLEDIHWLDALPPPFENHLQRLLKHVQDNLQEDRTKEERNAGDAARREEEEEEEEERYAREGAEQESRRRASEEESRRVAAAETAAARQRLHNDARRFARLLVSEIKNYHELEVIRGRAACDLYDRLREVIDRSRAMYDKRVDPQVASKYDYLHSEILMTLAEGNPSKLGDSYPGPILPQERR